MKLIVPFVNGKPYERDVFFHISKLYSYVPCFTTKEEAENWLREEEFGDILLKEIEFKEIEL